MHSLDSAMMSTKAIHYPHHKDPTGAVITPIYQSSTFVFDSAEQGGRRFAGQEEGYIYTRLGNPTTTTTEEKIAYLEHGEAAALTSSGMGAISSTMWTLLKTGDHVIADDTLYGCTHALFEHGLTKFGVEVTFLDTSVPGAVKGALKPNTKVVYFETPANPTMKCVDIERVVAEAKSQEGVMVVVDNTFSSPIICRPLDHGVDVVVHSVTKYINGHSDVVAGCVVSKKSIIAKIKGEGIKDMTGACPSPHDAYLITRGMMTLDLRVRKACKNAMKVAQFLEKHPAIACVNYPGLPGNKYHEVAKKQMDLFGAMISFELVGGLEAGKKLLNNLHIFVLAVSLGGCESLVEHPASMTHACVPREEREAAGLTDGLVRISVGVENVEDLIADLKQGLDLLL